MAHINERGGDQRGPTAAVTKDTQPARRPLVSYPASWGPQAERRDLRWLVVWVAVSIGLWIGLGAIIFHFVWIGLRAIIFHFAGVTP